MCLAVARRRTWEPCLVRSMKDFFWAAKNWQDTISSFQKDLTAANHQRIRPQEPTDFRHDPMFGWQNSVWLCGSLIWHQDWWKFSKRRWAPLTPWNWASNGHDFEDFSWTIPYVNHLSAATRNYWKRRKVQKPLSRKLSLGRRGGAENSTKKRCVLDVALSGPEKRRSFV